MEASEQGQAVAAIRLVEQRVLWLEGRSRAFADAIVSATRAVNTFADTHQTGTINTGTSPLRGRTVISSDEQLVAQERTQARNVGALLQTVQRARDDYQRAIDAAKVLELPENQRAHVEGLLVRGNRALDDTRTAQIAWRDNPISRFDAVVNRLEPSLFRHTIIDDLSFALTGASADVVGAAAARRADEIIEDAKRIGRGAGSGISWYAGFISRLALNQLLPSDYAMIALVGVSGVGALFLWISINKRL